MSIKDERKMIDLRDAYDVTHATRSTESGYAAWRSAAHRWKKAVSALTDTDWDAIIQRSSHSKRIRERLAGIIWWDYFECRRCTLTKYMDRFEFNTHVEPDDLFEALVSAGYPRCLAEARLLTLQSRGRYAKQSTG